MPSPEPEFVVDVTGVVIGAAELIADGKAVEVDGKIVPAPEAAVVAEVPAEPVAKPVAEAPVEAPVEPDPPAEPAEPTPAEG